MLATHPSSEDDASMMNMRRVHQVRMMMSSDMLITGGDCR